jgi:hypothetical protein
MKTKHAIEHNELAAQTEYRAMRRAEKRAQA